MKPGEIRPTNGKEMTMLEHMALLDARLTRYTPYMRDRLGAVPNGWRNWRLMQKLVADLLTELYKTVSDRNLHHFDLLCRYGEAHITERPVVHLKGYTNISGDDLEVLVRAAITSECLMCQKEGREVKRCPLRNVLQNITPPPEFNPYICEYLEIAIGMDDSADTK